MTCVLRRTPQQVVQAAGGAGVGEPGIRGQMRAAALSGLSRMPTANGIDPVGFGDSAVDAQPSDRHLAAALRGGEHQAADMPLLAACVIETAGPTERNFSIHSGGAATRGGRVRLRYKADLSRSGSSQNESY